MNRGVVDVDAVTELVASLVVRRCRDDGTTARPLGLHPHPRPRAAVRSAGRCAALLGRQGPAQQPQPRRRPAGHHRPGGAVGLPGRRSAGDPRPARRRACRTCPVRVRDGTGLVGPLVIPGMTSCLRCADLHRSDRDAAWPAVAAQLRDAVGSADRATMLATAALALSQVDRVIKAIRDAGDPRRAGEPPRHPRHHAGVRRQHRIDDQPPLVEASALSVLTIVVATWLSCVQRRHG